VSDDQPSTLDYAAGKSRSSRKKSIPVLLTGSVIAVGPTILLWKMVSYLFVVPLICGGFIIGLGYHGRASSQPRMRMASILTVTLLALLGGIGPLVLIWYLESPGPPIRLIFPSGFVGRWKFILDKENGQAWTKQNGRYVIPVPSTGDVRVRSLAPLTQWHSESAQYTDGTSIPAAGALAGPAIALHGGGYVGKANEIFIWGYLGTQAGCDAERRIMEEP